jgi:TPR repeat protein
MMMSPRFWTIALGLAIGLTSPAAAQTLKGKAALALPLAEAGDAVSQVALGVYYDVGAEGAPKDYAEALKWYRKAAEQGDGNGLVSMADMYAHGHGVSQNYVLAEMYVELAEAQHADVTLLKPTRALVRQHVTTAQTAEAKKRTAECLRANFKGCDKM